jgi:hypothetical protein
VRIPRSLSGLLCLAALSLTGSARGDFNVNLIVNGDAESGPGSATGNDLEPIPGWTITGNATVVKYGIGGGFPAASDPGPPSRGNNFFAGGPDNGASSLAQSIVLTAADATVIDSGGAAFDLSGYLGGFDGQGDNAVLTIVFRNAGATSLGSGQIGPVTETDRAGATGLLLRETVGTVPVGTRSIDVTLSLTRTSGSYNDAYADNLSLILRGAAVPEPASVVSLALGGVILAGLGRRFRRPRS